MIDWKKAFLIDLVKLNAAMRIFVFNENRFTPLDLSRQTGIGVQRIERVLVAALQSDFCDRQLELMVSQMDNITATLVEIEGKRETMYIRCAYPPLPVLSALTGLPHEQLEQLHNQHKMHQLEGALRSQFEIPVAEWVTSNLENAGNAFTVENPDQVVDIKSDHHKDSVVLAKPAETGMGLTDAFTSNAIAEYRQVDPKDVTIIGQL